MNNKKIVNFTNKISLVVVALLLYWIFIFISITVFDFKVFKQNITTSFYLSILGILALLLSAVIINIMFNLTSISESLQESKNRDTKEATISKSHNRKKISYGIFIGSFILIFAILMYGDYRTSKVREHKLIESAKYLIEENSITAEKLSNYNFNKKYITETEDNLDFIEKQSENFPNIYVIAKDTINGKTVFLRIYTYNYSERKKQNKVDYIYSCSKKEREYIKSVFNGNNNKYLFDANDGNYELYYPYRFNNKTIILYFTDYKRYGKIGS